jgi:hypothetical protein
MAEEKQKIQTYAEFWPHYLHQHSRRETRLLHIGGTLLALAAIFKALTSFHLGWLIAAPIIAYGFAWGAHAFVEENQPATWEYPLWSLRADTEMLGLWIAGRLESELAKYQITT